MGLTHRKNKRPRSVMCAGAEARYPSIVAVNRLQELGCRSCGIDLGCVQHGRKVEVIGVRSLSQLTVRTRAAANDTSHTITCDTNRVMRNVELIDVSIVESRV